MNWPSHIRMFVFGSALAIVLCAMIASTHPAAFSSFVFRYGFAAMIVAVAARLFYRKPAAPKGKIDPNTRAYARAMYYNGLISMEELNRFYASHPEDENGKPSKRT